MATANLVNTSSSLVQPLAAGSAEEQGPVKAWPVLIMCVGSTSAEAGVNVALRNRTSAKRVPFKIVYIDTTPYEVLADRLRKLNFSKSEIEEAMPRSHYLELKDPFQGKLAINDEINARWRRILFEDLLVQQASRSGSAPGSNGIPALGRLRAEGNDNSLRTFMRSRITELTQIDDSTLSLQPGVRAIVVTTCRGGTGTGATPYLGVALRSAMGDKGERHLIALMPDVFKGEDDERMRSNAYAQMQLLLACHSVGGGLPLLDGGMAEGPFTSVFPVFNSDGARSIDKGNAIAFVTSLICAQLRPTLQSGLTSRRVNLNDAAAFDPDGLPNHIEGHVAVSVRAAPEGALRFIALEWLRRDLQRHEWELENYLDGEPLGEEAERKITDLLEVAHEQSGALSRDKLLSALDGTASPAASLRASLEAAARKVPALSRQAIKAGMPGLVGEISGQFDGFDRAWRKQMAPLARKLPAEITAVTAKFGNDAPALQVETLRRAGHRFTDISLEAEAAAAAAGERRNQANVALDRALTEVQNAGPILGLLRGDEIVRDAAEAAFRPLGTAANSRLDQERNAMLARLITGQLGEDSDGHAVQNLVDSMRALAEARIPELRQWYRETLGAVGTLQAAARRTVDGRSVFDRALFYDGKSSAALVAEAVRQQALFNKPAPVTALLRGECSLEQAIDGLEKLLPAYNAAARPLLEVLQADPEKLARVITLVREIRPFLPIDPGVAQEQRLDNRRDTVAILELPGGKGSWLADRLYKEGAIDKLDGQVVESGEEALHYYQARVSLPYYALGEAENYRRSHEAYVKTVNAVTPYSVPNGESLPSLRAPRDDLRLRCRDLLAEGLLSGLVSMNRLTGSIHVSYVDHDDNEAPPFDTVDAAIAWAGRTTEARQQLEQAARACRENQPDIYIARLRERYVDAPEQLRMSLRSLARKRGIDLRPRPSVALAAE